MAEIRAGFERTYLRSVPAEWTGSDEGRAEVRREIVDKYELCRRHVVPWVARVAPLDGASLIEIGCGTGAKSAAFGQHVGSVLGCDVSAPHVEAARHRIAAVGLDNVELRHEPASSLLDRAASEGEAGVDIVLLFAVIEHMTLDERLDTLRRSWELLRPGGVLVVVETPNRLLPWDWHSSRLPFFNQLPDELALRYLDRSPRPEYVDAIRGEREKGTGEGIAAMTRQGRGVSYHEFELALGPELAELVVADGYDPEILEMNPIYLDEMELMEFFERERLGVPIGFTRYWLDLVLRKPSG